MLLAVARALCWPLALAFALRCSIQLILARNRAADGGGAGGGQVLPPPSIWPPKISDSHLLPRRF